MGKQSENGCTRLPVLQLYSRNVSSSPAVINWSPLSSKLIPVICLGDPFCTRDVFADGDGGGVGSTAFLNILAGFSRP